MADTTPKRQGLVTDLSDLRAKLATLDAIKKLKKNTEKIGEEGSNEAFTAEQNRQRDVTAAEPPTEQTEKLPTDPAGTDNEEYKKFLQDLEEDLEPEK